MPLQDQMKIISVDDHVFEHGKVWSDRLPAKYRGAGPHLIEDHDLGFWIFEDKATAAFTGLGVASGLRREDYTLDVINPRDVIPGATDPAERVKDMDIDGVWAQLCFPSFPKFAGVRFLEFKDKELALLCVQAYNDFILDEWCASAPERFIPLMILPLWDAQLAAQELERTVAKGAKSVSFPENPTPLGLKSIFSGYWDPMFAVANEAGVPLSMHFGSSGVTPKASPDAPGMLGNGPVQIALMGTTSMASAAEWVFSPVFVKFPNLRVALSEGGIGWIPWLKERLDYTWERQRFWSGLDANVRPSELFDDHIFGCFIDDETGIRDRANIGLKNIMLESDYPHSDSSWPFTRKRAGEVLADVPDDEAHMIVELNARALYNFPA